MRLTCKGIKKNISSKKTGRFSAIVFMAVLAIVVFVSPVSAYAQSAQPSPSTSAPKAKAPTKVQDISPDKIPSILFTYWEHTALLDAKKSRGRVRPPTHSEMRATLPQDDRPRPPPEARYIRLGGILYSSTEEWTIWLNGKRVTPKAMPREVLDLKVSEEFIDIKWHDDYTNQIYPVRLKPHHRFHLDMRIFLPG